MNTYKVDFQYDDSRGDAKRGHTILSGEDLTPSEAMRTVQADVDKRMQGVNVTGAVLISNPEAGGEWPTEEEEERIKSIGQNGNTGEHYDSDRSSIEKFVKQKRYLANDGSGEDWIDECARTLTPEEFRGAMKFTIGKYERRLGKKDDVYLELHKISDYYHRWSQYEKQLEEQDSELNFSDTITLN